MIAPWSPFDFHGTVVGEAAALRARHRTLGRHAVRR
jgi:hypothetical protein